MASVNRTGTDDKMKVARPDFFYGDRYKLDDWLNQILLYFHLEGVKEEKRSLTAASYLRGEAQRWVQPRQTDKLLRNQDPEGLFGDFRWFVLKVRSIYGLSNDQQVAIRYIQHVTQKASASQFSAKFSEYAAKAGWEHNALQTMYYRGLKDNVKDELMRYGGDQSTLSGIRCLTKIAFAVVCCCACVQSVSGCRARPLCTCLRSFRRLKARWLALPWICLVRTDTQSAIVDFLGREHQSLANANINERNQVLQDASNELHGSFEYLSVYAEALILSHKPSPAVGPQGAKVLQALSRGSRMKERASEMRIMAMIMMAVS